LGSEESLLNKRQRREWSNVTYKLEKLGVEIRSLEEVDNFELCIDAKLRASMNVSVSGLIRQRKKADIARCGPAAQME
jgi:hypothetical protein